MNNVWLHRIGWHREIAQPLLEKGYLTIGFSIFTQEANIFNGDWDDFEKAFDTFCGERLRQRYNLWRFINEMKKGDWVLVPGWGTFSIYELTEDAAMFISKIEGTDFKDWSGKSVTKKEDGLYDVDGKKIDLGFFRKVKPIAEEISRNDYADSKLTSRMKVRQTTVNINDLEKEVKQSYSAFSTKKPINIYSQIIEQTSQQILDTIHSQLNPDKFEKLVKWYFERVGATKVDIPAKNESGKEGDADIVAVFEPLKLIVYVQVKYHKGQTSGFAVEQIKDYKGQKETINDGYSRISWVISSANDFSEDAKMLAEKEGILLINGTEFVAMTLNAGITNLEFAF